MAVKSTVTVFFLLFSVSSGLVVPILSQEPGGESRMQAVLKLNGEFLPNGGMIITEAPKSGPGASLELPNAPTPTRGILEKGDVIVEIEGQRFQDRREFLDLMNDAYRKHGGKVRITVKDVSTGRLVGWISRPEVAQMTIPASHNRSTASGSGQPRDEFEAELGAPPKSPSSPTILTDKFAL